MNNDEKCPICIAVKESLEKRDESIFNKGLYESDSFIVMPCIGPLEIGHVMIVSKTHYESLASMGSGAIKEMKNIIEVAFENKSIYKGSLITEHGAFLDQSGGACIVHTHIHVIPEQGKWIHILDEILPQIKVKSLEDLTKIDIPYIFTSDIEGNFKVYQSFNAHPQMVRKAICAKTKRLDYDWAQDEKLDFVKKTLEYW